MPNYIVTGKLGAGKGKFGVSRMREALQAGKRVATNFDLFHEHLTPASCRHAAIRVPDRPTFDDLMALGHGQPGDYDEDKMGELHLDECASWLNTRQYADKGRAALIDWIVHARKHGWCVYFYVQGLEMIDKQIREALADYCVKIIRADRIKVPVVGGLLPKKLSTLPRIHMANISMIDVPGVVIDRDYFRGDDLHDAYNTRQVFREWNRDPKHPGFATEDCMGPFSYLSAWHVKGRHDTPKPARSALARLFAAPARPRPAPKPKLALVARLEALPPDQRIYWFHRLRRVGLA